MWKFMNASADALNFTNNLLSTIRLQRHLGARVMISTQEPTISPVLLDLSSVTIVHRFTSLEMEGGDANNDSSKSRDKTKVLEQMLDEVVTLKVGEALLFAPSTIVGTKTNVDQDTTSKRLGMEYLRMRIRLRLTSDGGKSVMAF